MQKNISATNVEQGNSIFSMNKIDCYTKTRQYLYSMYKVYKNPNEATNPLSSKM